MSNIEKTKVNAIIKQTKKLSVFLVLGMLFLSVLTVGIVGEQEIKPDLTISGLVVHGKTVEGEEITFEVTIVNQQDVDINENIRIGLYHDYSWGIPIGTIMISGGLGGNESESVNLSWTAEPGVYTFSIFVDYPNEIVEEDENNNVWDVALNFSERNTDFIFLESEPIIGEERRVDAPVTVSATVKNIGKNNSEDITVALYVNDSKKQDMTIDGLSKGETYPLSFVWTPKSFGVYTISIEINPGPDRPISEETYDNNVISKDNVYVNITSLQWWNPNWHYRKFYEVAGIGNLTIEVNFTEMLNQLDIFGKTFENDTITIVKYTTTPDPDIIVVENYSFNKSVEFDNITNAMGNLTWVANESLYYCIYFDVTENNGTRTGLNETLDINTSGTPPSVFEKSVDAWWSYFSQSFYSYYYPNGVDEMSIQVNTTALAETVTAYFTLEGTLDHFVELESDDYLTWSGISTFSTEGDWKLIIVSNDTAGYQPANLTYEFYVGTPDLTVTNITFSSSLPGSSPFYEGYNVLVEANVTAFNATLYGVTVLLEVKDEDEQIKQYYQYYQIIFQDESNIIPFEPHFNESGRYEITVEVDPEKLIPESNEDNNTFSKTINISGVPDLGVVNISVPTNYFDGGDRVEIYTNVNNTGNENATDYRVNLYLEKNDDDVMHYTGEKNHTFVSLKINETKNISLIWDSAEPGEWIVGIKILQNATKPDSNILNNSKARFDVRVKVNSTEPQENNAPVIDILEPQSLEEFERNLPVEIIAKITDESGLEKVDILITDPDNTTYEEVMAKQENDKYSYTFEETSILGVYDFSINAVDKSANDNNATESSKFKIVEDATPPEIEYIGVLPSVQLKDKDVTISSIISDRSGVKFVQVTITYPDGSSETKNMTNSSNDKKYYFTQSYEMLGRYVFYITTEDTLENKKTTKNEEVDFWITIDLEDTDSDGMPDYWEEKYGFDPYDPTDATEDEDDDGYTNLEEYNEDMNPLEPLSLLQRIVKESKENWIYVLVSGILFIVVIALSIYGIRRRKT